MKIENVPQAMQLDAFRRRLVQERAMPFSRYRDIQAAERAGRPLDITASEREEYEQFDQAMLAALQEIARPKEQPTAPQQPKFFYPPPPKVSGQLANPNAGVEEKLENLLGAMVEQRQQDEQNAKYLELMARTLQETAKARESADHRVDEQAKVNKRFTIAAIVLAAISSISIFPVLIEFWRAITGG